MHLGHKQFKSANTYFSHLKNTHIHTDVDKPDTMINSKRKLGSSNFTVLQCVLYAAYDYHIHIFQFLHIFIKIFLR